MLDTKELEVIAFLKRQQESSSKEIHEGMSSTIGYATVKRILTKLVAQNLITIKGQRKSTKYQLSAAYELLESIDLDKYYEKEIDEREIKENFNFQLITDVLSQYNLFTENELVTLSGLQNTYKNNISHLSSGQ